MLMMLQLDNRTKLQTLYFYGFFKSTLINNGVAVERERMLAQ